jgi:hypothetical protein
VYFGPGITKKAFYNNGNVDEIEGLKLRLVFFDEGFDCQEHDGGCQGLARLDVLCRDDREAD